MAESRCPESRREKEARKTEIVMGYCNKRDLERLGEELRKRVTARRNWRLLIQNVVRQTFVEEKRRNGNHGQLTPDDRDAKKRRTTKCSLTLV